MVQLESAEARLRVSREARASSQRCVHAHNPLRATCSERVPGGGVTFDGPRRPAPAPPRPTHVTTGSMWGFYATMMTVCSATVVLMLRKLSAPRVAPVILGVTFVGWLTSLSVVALVPIDVYSALAHREPGSLDVLWSISYWCVCVCMCWAGVLRVQAHGMRG